MSEKNIYHYHPETFEYLGGELADESPLEPGVYLVPANATLKSPFINNRVSENETFVFNEDSDSWSVKADFRGFKYYLEGSSTEHEIKELGEQPPLNFLTEKPEPTQEEKDLLEVFNFQMGRKKLLSKVDHYQMVLVWNDLTEDQKEQLIQYRRTLLDIPENQKDGFPYDIKWPDKPDFFED